MIIWSGFGFLAPAIAIFFLIMAEYVSEEITKNTEFYQQHHSVGLLAMLISGIVCWLIGNYLNKKQGKVVIEKDTGKEVLLKPSHTFFFIPLRIYGFIWPIIGIFILFGK